ncbi:hypothetical protein SRS16CHR_04871 [Variovorax sp. SRS16]|uniref:hypothetical protein n=1 Tax=Variovorax sp. SRS16 TaxID=282217 RepID=UPI00131949A8|nr:hypothetical protein [Variovorax sp. SRS16]VTU31400.1 hypothetical protein SRS16CHR_04871 [Variovorax sp. SRS16]
MKKLLISLVATLPLGAAWPAFAGPDFQLIEKARADRQAAVAAQMVNASRVDRATGQRVNCPPEPLALPLDHGPRAQTTPGENRMRKARYEAQVKACTNPAL